MSLTEHVLLRLENEGGLSEALRCFKEALELDRGQTSAKEHLQKVQQKIMVRNQVGRVRANI